LFYIVKEKNKNIITVKRKISEDKSNKMTYSEHELSVVVLVAIITVIAVVVAVFVLRSGGNLTPNIITQTRDYPCVCNVQCAMCNV
jgi:uncharacterized membrane-anchored protein